MHANRQYTSRASVVRASEGHPLEFIPLIADLFEEAKVVFGVADEAAIPGERKNTVYSKWDNADVSRFF